MKRALAPLALVLLACGTSSGDPHLDAGPPTPLGAGARIKDVADPSSPKHPNVDPTKNGTAPVVVTGATVLWVDTFDETRNGKSRGTVYVQDVGSQDGFSGISLYSPTYIPGDLRVAPGDVLDLDGNYQENGNIGSAVFPDGQVLPQIAKPVATFRYEYRTPDPVEIDPTDLDDYAKGRRWLNMLVTVKNVTLVDGIAAEVSSSTGAPTGRVTGHLTAAKKCKITNELFDLQGATSGTVVKSLTGVVTYFFDMHIAPRSAADIVVQ